jgi:hypothetical protein
MSFSSTDVERLRERTNAKKRFASMLESTIEHSAIFLHAHKSVFLTAEWKEHTVRCNLGNHVLKITFATIEFWLFMISAVQNRVLGSQKKVLAGMKFNLKTVMREYQHFAEKMASGEGIVDFTLTEPIGLKLQLLVYGKPGCSFEENEVAYRVQLVEMLHAIKAVQDWKFETRPTMDAMKEID